APGGRRQSFRHRTRAAAAHVAARGDEAPRGALRGRADRAPENRSHRGVRTGRDPDGAGRGLAQPLPALLVRTSRSSRRIRRGECMSTAVATRPSLTLKRRLNAPPAKVYQAWTDPQKMMRWYAPANAETLAAESDTRVGGRF